MSQKGNTRPAPRHAKVSHPRKHRTSEPHTARAVSSRQSKTRTIRAREGKAACNLVELSRCGNEAQKIVSTELITNHRVRASNHALNQRESGRLPSTLPPAITQTTRPPSSKRCCSIRVASHPTNRGASCLRHR